jgi:hypothetical protein
MEFSDATEKIPSKHTGIDPGTFRLVEQCLNHYVTAGPNMWLLKICSQLSFVVGNVASVNKNGIKHNTVRQNK